jgi:hypothetical protein
MTDTFEILKRFDELPDTALAPPKVTAIVLNMSERTLRRHPPIPRVQTSPQKFGFHVGAIRALIRRGNPQTA